VKLTPRTDLRRAHNASWQKLYRKTLQNGSSNFQMRNSRTSDISKIMEHRALLRGLLELTGLTGALPALKTAARTLDAQADSAQSEDTDQLHLAPVLGERQKLLMAYAVFRELQLGSVRPQVGSATSSSNKQMASPATSPISVFHSIDITGQETREAKIRSPQPWNVLVPLGVGRILVDDAYRCAKLIDECSLWKRAMDPIRYTVKHPIDGWFLGPRQLLLTRVLNSTKSHVAFVPVKEGLSIKAGQDGVKWLWLRTYLNSRG
jgi:hypothetical protein